MAFEAYQPVHSSTRRVEAPDIAIGKGGENSRMNKAAVELLGQPEGIRLHYDAAWRFIGFESADPSHEGAYLLGRRRDHPSYRTISLTGLLKYYRIKPPSRARHYTPMLFSERLLVICLHAADTGLDPWDWWSERVEVWRKSKLLQALNLNGHGAGYPASELRVMLMERIFAECKLPPGGR